MTDRTERDFAERRIRHDREIAAGSLESLAASLERQVTDLRNYAERVRAEATSDEDAANCVDWAVNGFQNTSYSAVNDAQSAAKSINVWRGFVRGWDRKGDAG